MFWVVDSAVYQQRLPCAIVTLFAKPFQHRLASGTGQLLSELKICVALKEQRSVFQVKQEVVSWNYGFMGIRLTAQVMVTEIFSTGYSLLVTPCHSAAFVAVLVYGYGVGSRYKVLKKMLMLKIFCFLPSGSIGLTRDSASLHTPSV